MIGVVYVLAALLAAATGGLITFAVMNSRARDQREAARILASSTAGELVRAKDAIERLTKDLKTEQERADALDDELVAAYDVPDPAGARDRVLAKWKLQHDTSRGRAVTLPASRATAPTGPDDLQRPGD